MAKDLKALAIYRLPSSIALTPSCFGKTIAVKIGTMKAVMKLPVITWNGENPYVTAPATDSKLNRYIKHYAKDESRPHYWGAVGSWHPKRRLVVAATTSAVLFEFHLDPSNVSYSDYLYGRGHPLSPELDRLYSNIDSWFENLREWIEAVYDQETDPNSPIRSVKSPGAGLQALTIEGETVSLPASNYMIQVNMQEEDPVDITRLRKIISRVNRGIRPFDEYVLLSDARREYRRSLYKRAVIDAGTACEIALASYNMQVTKVPISTSRPPTLGWYIGQKQICANLSIPANAQRVLVKVRNDAVHANLIPSAKEAKKAIDTSIAIVNSVRELNI